MLPMPTWRRKKRGGRNRTEHSKFVGQYQKSNICVTEITEEKRVNGAEEEIFEEIMAIF